MTREDMNIKAKLTALIRTCRISIFCGEVLIVCPHHKVFSILIRHRKLLPTLVHEAIKKTTVENNHSFLLGSITIGIGGKKATFSPSNTYICDIPMIPSSDVLLSPAPQSPTQADLITECMSYSGACGIIRMSDHKGLFSNSLIVQSSNAHPNDWVGKKMSDWWIEDELNPYIQRLLNDKELHNYSYVAKMMSGENARLTVNARLVIWNGEPARLVKTISREYLS